MAYPLSASSSHTSSTPPVNTDSGFPARLLQTTPSPVVCHYVCLICLKCERKSDDHLHHTKVRCNSPRGFRYPTVFRPGLCPTCHGPFNGDRAPLEMIDMCWWCEEKHERKQRRFPRKTWDTFKALFSRKKKHRIVEPDGEIGTSLVDCHSIWSDWRSETRGDMDVTPAAHSGSIIFDWPERDEEIGMALGGEEIDLGGWVEELQLDDSLLVDDWTDDDGSFEAHDIHDTTSTHLP